VLPPFTGLAVNVTEVPEHTVVEGVEILIPATRFELTDMTTLLEKAGFETGHS
jgi:hypothetical protein